MTVRLYDDIVSYNSLVTILSAACGLTMNEKPIPPTIAITKATGILLTRRTNNKMQPRIPNSMGVMV